MSYLVLARKWRPMRFEDLVGQGHVAQTLANAIQRGRVAHAFLFTGVRGVGKTTSARILAKTLNCMGKPGSEPLTAPPVTPCLECPACLEIAAGTDLDVREIDGASYNGVDEVRKLQDGIPYRPARDRYKIIIVDEVHMLSTNAWNALLKTLEEPPPHVKFIFATTEVHKVPVTILSRVQRFDFKLIPSQQIVQRLQEVLGHEGIAMEEGALHLLAREAAGSMRDAMSLLDQVLAWKDQALTSADVAAVLGVASHRVLYDLASALVDGEARRCLELVAGLAEEGHELSHVARDLLAVLRALVVAKVCAEPTPLLDLAEDEQRDVLALAARTSVEDLTRLHQGFSASFDDLRLSGQPRAALEMALVRLALRPPLVPLDDLIGRLGALERSLRGAARGGALPPAAAPPRGALEPSPPPPPEQQGRPGRAQPREHRAEAARASSGTTADSDGPRAPSVAPPPERSAAAALGGAVEPGAPSDQQERGAGAEAEPLGPWRKIVELVSAEAPRLGAFLKHAAPLEVGPELIRLRWPAQGVHLGEIDDGAEQRRVAQLAATILGAEPRIVHLREGTDERGSVAEAISQERAEELRLARERALAAPALRLAREVLGARLLDIVLPNTE